MTTLLSHNLRPRTAPPRRPAVPPLRNGDHLSQPEFHRRYEAMPDGVKAELIGGVVYMPPPVGQGHGDPHLRVATILGVYEAGTPGVRASDNATVILGADSQPQPDLHLRLTPECGGRVRLNAEGYLVGPPELVLEVAYSSEATDVHEKRDDYRRARVLEYLVLCVRERQLRGFDLTTGRERPADRDGVYRSKVFPGLWVDVDAVLTGDTARVLAVLRQGLATPAHAVFAAKLAGRRAKQSRANGVRSRRRKPNA